MYELIVVIVVGAAPAIVGVIDLAERARDKWIDYKILKRMQKHPKNWDDREQRFYVKSTHSKYKMGRTRPS